MSDSDIETSWGNRTLSVIGGVGFILLFLLILWIAYLPYRPEPISKVLAETRLENLQEVQNASAESVSSYGVVNQRDGIYRIPVSEAMKLTVEEYRTSSGSEDTE